RHRTADLRLVQGERTFGGCRSGGSPGGSREIVRGRRRVARRALRTGRGRGGGRSLGGGKHAAGLAERLGLGCRRGLLGGGGVRTQGRQGDEGGGRGGQGGAGGPGPEDGRPAGRR